jgi:hypothetical protein
MDELERLRSIKKQLTRETKGAEEIQVWYRTKGWSGSTAKAAVSPLHYMKANYKGREILDLSGVWVYCSAECRPHYYKPVLIIQARIFPAQLQQINSRSPNFHDNMVDCFKQLRDRTKKVLELVSG